VLLWLFSSGHILLTDFGMSRQFRHTDATSTSLCGTPEYLAPEIAAGAPHSFPVRIFEWL
jgi:serine/threonine protein kinase